MSHADGCRWRWGRTIAVLCLTPMAADGGGPHDSSFMSHAGWLQMAVGPHDSSFMSHAGWLQTAVGRAQRADCFGKTATHLVISTGHALGRRVLNRDESNRAVP